MLVAGKKGVALQKPILHAPNVKVYKLYKIIVFFYCLTTYMLYICSVIKNKTK